LHLDRWFKDQCKVCLGGKGWTCLDFANGWVWLFQDPKCKFWKESSLEVLRFSFQKVQAEEGCFQWIVDLDKFLFGTLFQNQDIDLTLLLEKNDFPPKTKSFWVSYRVAQNHKIFLKNRMGAKLLCKVKYFLIKILPFCWPSQILC